MIFDYLTRIRETDVLADECDKEVSAINTEAKKKGQTSTAPGSMA